MKTSEITTEDLINWKRKHYIPVACRICNEVELFPDEQYKEEQLVGWECSTCKQRFY